jgi:hypothetical protein
MAAHRGFELRTVTATAEQCTDSADWLYWAYHSSILDGASPAVA